MRGKGYSITWPKDEGGITPWKDGKGDLVKMQEYGPGGMISAAPGPARLVPPALRLSARTRSASSTTPAACPATDGRLRRRRRRDRSASRSQRSLTDIDKGGRAIPYHMEDPYIREYFEQKLQEEGAEFTMPPEVYTKEGSNIKVMTD